MIGEVFRDFHYTGKTLDAETAAKEIVTRARPHTCSSRAIYVSNEKVVKKVEKLKLSSGSDASKFAQMVVLVRRKLKHRGVRQIQPGEPEWFQIKEAAMLATEFCNEFGITVQEGYKYYIEIGMGMMANFSFTKFKSIHSAICTKYEAQEEIDADRHPAETKKAHDEYLRIISEKTGSTIGFEDRPEKYKYFIPVVDEAKKYGVSAKQYLQAQFAGFDWRSGVPEPVQLTGTKAVERLIKWAYEHNVPLGQKKKGIDFKALKQND